MKRSLLLMLPLLVLLGGLAAGCAPAARVEAALQQVCGGRVMLTLATHPDPAGATTRVDAPARPNPKQQQASAAADPASWPLAWRTPFGRPVLPEV